MTAKEFCLLCVVIAAYGALTWLKIAENNPLPTIDTEISSPLVRHLGNNADWPIAIMYNHPYAVWSGPTIDGSYGDLRCIVNDKEVPFVPDLKGVLNCGSFDMEVQP